MTEPHLSPQNYRQASVPMSWGDRILIASWVAGYGMLLGAFWLIRRLESQGKKSTY